MNLRLPVLAAAFLAAACASTPPQTVPPSMFVVVPASDGHVGSVVVERGGERRVVDQAYAGQRVREDGAVEPVRLSRAEVDQRFGPTLAALPGRPASFTLYFIEGRDELTADSRTELERVFAELKRRPLPDIVVIGHTDTVGSLAFNDKLSLQRAERLRELLVGLGLPADRIQAAGRGKRELMVPTADNVAEPRNRRVEISVR